MLFFFVLGGEAETGARRLRRLCTPHGTRDNRIQRPDSYKRVVGYRRICRAAVRGGVELHEMDACMCWACDKLL